MNCKNCGARLPIDGKCEYCGSYDKEADCTDPKPTVDETIDEVFPYVCPNCGGLPIILSTKYIEDLSWGVMCKCDTCGKHSALYKVDYIDTSPMACMRAAVDAFQDFQNGRFVEQYETILYADDKEVI